MFFFKNAIPTQGRWSNAKIHAIYLVFKCLHLVYITQCKSCVKMDTYFTLILHYRQCIISATLRCRHLLRDDISAGSNFFCEISHCKITVKPLQIYNAPHCKFYNAFFHFTMRLQCIYNILQCLHCKILQCSHCNFTVALQ